MGWISDKKYWEPGIDQHGEQLRDVCVVDATRILQQKNYPPGTRIYVRAEPLHSGAKASLFDADGNFDHRDSSVSVKPQAEALQRSLKH